MYGVFFFSIFSAFEHKQHRKTACGILTKVKKAFPTFTACICRVILQIIRIGSKKDKSFIDFSLYFFWEMKDVPEEAAMKFLRNRTFLAVIYALALFPLQSCMNMESGEAAASAGNSGPTSYVNLSVGRAFIGGSLVYNPKDAGTNQLRPGTTIAVREGSLRVVTETAEVYEGQNGRSVDTNAAVSTRREITSYEDIPERAVYGYIVVNYATPDAISFSYTRYAAEGHASSSASYTLHGGEGVDLNGDGMNNLVYRRPDCIRDGFEEAMWLEFVCDSDCAVTGRFDHPATTMFSVIKKGEESGMKRSADGASLKESDYGLYGVNSAGRYIYIVEDKGSYCARGAAGSVISRNGLQYGDIVLAVDKESEINLSEDGGADSFVASFASDYDTSLSLNNTEIGTCYTYVRSQFASDRGPADLLSHLPEKVLNLADLSSAAIPSSSAECIDALNEILSRGREASGILLDPATGLVNQVSGEWLNVEMDADPVRTARRLMDLLFRQSPQAELEQPSVTNMYPFLSLDLRSACPVFDGNETSSNRMAQNYSDYDKQQKSISDKFAKYVSLELKSVNFGEGNKELKDYGLKVALGLDGRLSIAGSSAGANVSAVVYVKLDLRTGQVASWFTKEFLDSLKQEISKTVMVGPVPISVAVKMEFGLDFALKDCDGNDLDICLCYCGLYGAGVDVGAKWGFIYLNFWKNAYVINETAWYFGGRTDTADVNLSKGLKYVVTPSVKVTPKVGLGPSWANFNMGVPVTASLPVTLTGIVPVIIPEKVELELKVGLQAGLDIGVWKFKVSHCFYRNDNLFTPLFGKNSTRWVLYEKA